MKLYPSFEALPKFADYIGSDDMGPGSMSEHLADLIDHHAWGKTIAYIVDRDGFRSFFCW